METFWKSLSIENCLLELLLNSLKAEATAIAVRIDAHKRRIQVVDNGFGIAKNDLRYIGENIGKKNFPETFASSENNLPIVGENLIKIRGLSSCLIIMSKSCVSSETYGKFFVDGKDLGIRKIENRPVCGTTITVYTSTNFHGWDDVDSFAIRYIIVYLAVANTQVSFSVRDDTNSSILLRIGKRQKYRQLLRVVCERPLSRDDVHFTKIFLGAVKIKFFWGVESTNSRKIQQILLNLRPVQCSLLNNFIIKTVRKMNKEKVNFSLEKIFFLLYIECSDSMYKLSTKNDKVIVKFYHIDNIVDSIGKILMKSDSRESILSDLNYKPTIPPLTFGPTGRILGVKQKRSFMTKPCRQSLENRRNLTRKEDEERETLSIIKNSSILKYVKSGVINVDTDDALSKPIPLKRDDYHDIPEVAPKYQRYMQKSEKDPGEAQSRNGNCKILDVAKFSQISQRCVEKSDRDCEKSVKILENGNRADILTPRDPREYRADSQYKNQEEDLPIKNCVHNNDDASWISQKCIEKSQKDAREFFGISLNKNLDNNLPMRNYNYDNHDITWISEKCIEKSQQNTAISHISVEKSSATAEEMFAIDECSQWSNWTYHPETRPETTKKSHEADHPIIWTRFRKFLPLNLHPLLPYGNMKLIRRDPLENERVPLNLNFNYRCQDLDVRPCKRGTIEIRLKMQSLKSMKVLNQVNREFIVASMQQDDKTLLVMIDQHAMHERIRYENLLRAYKRDSKNPQIISLTLHRPIIISDLSEINCHLLWINRDLLMECGLNLSYRDINTLMIFTVPRCFLKKTFYTDNTKLEIAVRKLLQEILENLTNNKSKKFLPLTVHDAIASEACHGAIKFGDPLTPDQCDALVSHWKVTDTPNRCAHGRPSVIPLLELSSYQTNKYKTVFQKKLNFAALLKCRAYARQAGIAELIGRHRYCDVRKTTR